ncbi:hypothetical protein A2T98_13070 [Nodularia spumigena CENA596]|uniref:Uncharacterized protein n=1 Tax=Nodularia spumigena CENA596 TaxID=1819295 RepID=A0A161XL17_NODSP|nr:hypothetical protein [Nodularia spumigena]KZL49344.1 hypothetical protein A2T98_13070 [Nodularia spumigena CENA596]
MDNAKVKEIVEALEISIQELTETVEILKEWDEVLGFDQSLLESLTRKQLNSSFSKVYARLNSIYVRLFIG